VKPYGPASPEVRNWAQLAAVAGSTGQVVKCAPTGAAGLGGTLTWPATVGMAGQAPSGQGRAAGAVSPARANRSLTPLMPVMHIQDP
jgi:hypothetical protein